MSARPRSGRESRPPHGRQSPIIVRNRESFAQEARHAVYGSVIVLAVIVAFQDTDVRAAEALGSVVAIAIATLFAEIYAEYLGDTIRARRRPTWAELRRTAANTVLGFVAALVPALFFVLALLDLVSRDAAFELAIWTGLVVVGGYAFAANRLAGFSVFHSLQAGIGFAFLGLLVIGLEAAVE